jgi:hypothetical protein
MGKQKDLLPWIFSGLLLACVAAAVAVGSYKLAPSAAQAPIQATLHPSPMPVAAVPPPPAASVPPTALTAAAIPAPTVAAAPVESAAAPVPTGGHVWECTTNGQKTFSDNPCGAKSTLREISPINIMSSASARPLARAYGPQSNYAPDSNYSPESNNEPEPSYAPDNSYSGSQEYSNGAYPVLIGIPNRNRARPDHTHRPYHASHGSPPRKS